MTDKLNGALQKIESVLLDAIETASVFELDTYSTYVESLSLIAQIRNAVPDDLPMSVDWMESVLDGTIRHWKTAYPMLKASKLLQQITSEDNSHVR